MCRPSRLPHAPPSEVGLEEAAVLLSCNQSRNCFLGEEGTAWPVLAEAGDGVAANGAAGRPAVNSAAAVELCQEMELTLLLLRFARSRPALKNRRLTGVRKKEGRQQEEMSVEDKPVKGEESEKVGATSAPIRCCQSASFADHRVEAGKKRQRRTRL